VIASKIEQEPRRKSEHSSDGYEPLVVRRLAAALRIAGAPRKSFIGSTHVLSSVRRAAVGRYRKRPLQTARQADDAQVICRNTP